MSEQVWIVGRVNHWDAERTVWQFQGVFSSAEQAEEACRDEDYFVGPATVNQKLPHDAFVWPGAWYPKLQERPVSA